MRQGRLPDARRSTASSATAGDSPVHRFLTTGQPEEFATHGRRFLGPELEAVTQFAGGAVGDTPHEAHRDRQLRFLPRSRVLGQLLPARGASTTAAPGGSCSTSATARSARCSAIADATDDRRCLPLPPARRPLPGPLRLLRDAQVPPRRCAAEDPGLRPGRHGPSDGQGLRPRRGPGDERGVRLHPLRHHRRRVRSVHASPRARWCTPSRRTPCASRPEVGCSPTPATAGCAPGSTTRPATPTCSCARRRSSRVAPNPPDLHLTGAEAGRTAAQAQGPAAAADPHPAVARPAGGAGRGGRGVRRQDRARDSRHVVRHLSAESSQSRRMPVRKPVVLSGMMARVIMLENVTKRYGQFTAVDDVSFTALPGRVTGFLGPNGAGKSTSMRVMVGLTPRERWSGDHRRTPLLRDPQPGRARGRAARRLGPARRPHRPRGAPRQRRDDGRRTPAGRGDARAGRALRHRGQAAGAQLLARHAPAARHRQRLPRRPVDPDPRRAGQRPRPGRHPLDARAAAPLRLARAAPCCSPRTCSTRSR